MMTLNLSTLMTACSRASPVTSPVAERLLHFPDGSEGDNLINELVHVHSDVQDKARSRDDLDEFDILR
ncbi:hypothetical protein [Halogeometricum sp. CBA1124]|uniref:hypothetical protein n=1 Tax=Halogeometricum sp. CBA1124 TaxID=2668071 RepID=UPI00142D1A03|nr:hypothetical protein [Halogeometricum sp. CBA1124]MUV56243.1 hypothetical protein [Halogeometricum sp. CBA1124]